LVISTSLEGATRAVGSRRRLAFLIIGMAVVGFTVVLVAFFVLYGAAFESQRARLIETVRSRARLIESVADFDRRFSIDYPGGPTEATLAQITAAHEQFEGFGGTSEFTLAMRQGDSMVFLLIHGQSAQSDPPPIPIESDLAEPMRRALRGESGTVVGLDYRGDLVLAAYEPAAGLGFGVVAKVEIAEIRAPFIRAGIWALIAGVVLIGIGALLFRAIMEPLIGEVWASEHRFRSLFERSVDAIAIVDAEGVLKDANDALYGLLGHARKDLLGKKVESLYSDPERRRSFVDAIDATGSVRDFEAQLRREDSSEIDCLLTAATRIGPKGDYLGHVTIIRDVTEKKQAEALLRFQATMLSSMADAVITSEPDFSIRGWNLGAERMYGWQADDVLGKTMPDVVDIEYPHNTREGVLEEFQKHGYWSGEVVHTNRDGRRMRVLSVVTQVKDDAGEPVGAVAVNRDITQRVQTEEELRAERNRAQLYLDIASVMLVVLDSDGRVTLINRKGLEILGYDTQEEVLGTDWFETCIPEEEVARVKDVFYQVLSGDVEPVEYHRNPVLTKSGEQRIIAFHNALLFDDARNPTGVLSSGEDITERQRVEEAMRASEAEYRELFENAPYGIYRSTTDGRFSAVNPALVRMLRYDSADELLQIDIARDLYVEAAEREQFVRQQRDRNTGFDEEALWCRKDGKHITVALKGRSIVSDDGTIVGFEAMAEDVTDQRQLESQLRQAQKMEAIGQLTGGIAHDFNNELLVILLNTQMLAEGIERGETPRVDELSDIKEAAQRASEITQQLVGFSRRAALKRVPTDLASRAKKLSAMLSRILPANIQVKTDADESVASVIVDPSSVEQMLLNLATNAQHAMPDGGELVVRVWEEDLDDAYCSKYPPTTPGRYVLLSVTDTGTGMEEEVRGKIFEPFFTTRPVGEGTGLGMAMVYGLTKQQQGFVHVDSKLGHGTSIRLAFPIVEETAASTGEHPVATSAVTGGKEAILFVDDEQALRRVGQRVLESHGYSVVTATDGVDALEKLQSDHHKFDLIITDLMMPNMGGADFCSTMEEKGMTHPVILASGHSDRDVQGQVASRQDLYFIRKPWSVREMLSAVRKALDT
jgi:PAS domain S-box-containing protein